jgi:hypothetical protein
MIGIKRSRTENKIGKESPELTPRLAAPSPRRQFERGKKVLHNRSQLRARPK